MFNFGSNKRRKKSPATQLNKLNKQIQREKLKVEVKKAKATLASMKLRS
jgi:hypothetical protein